MADVRGAPRATRVTRQRADMYNDHSPLGVSGAIVGGDRPWPAIVIVPSFLISQVIEKSPLAPLLSFFSGPFIMY
jgi:hypothetical protein